MLRMLKEPREFGSPRRLGKSGPNTPDRNVIRRDKRNDPARGNRTWPATFLGLKRTLMHAHRNIHFSLPSLPTPLFSFSFFFFVKEKLFSARDITARSWNESGYRVSVNFRYLNCCCVIVSDGCAVSWPMPREAFKIRRKTPRSVDTRAGRYGLVARSPVVRRDRYSRMQSDIAVPSNSYTSMTMAAAAAAAAAAASYIDAAVLRKLLHGPSNTPDLNDETAEIERPRRSEQPRCHPSRLIWRESSAWRLPRNIDNRPSPSCIFLGLLGRPRDNPARLNSVWGTRHSREYQRTRFLLSRTIRRGDFYSRADGIFSRRGVSESAEREHKGRDNVGKRGKTKRAA